jgi:hypothetical protein
MQFTRLVRTLGFALVEFADGRDMAEAQRLRLADELGISLEVPKELVIEVDGSQREITDKMRTLIIDAHERITCKDLWLRKGGPRDQICVRLGLTPEQVRGVLSRHTRRKRNGGKPAAPAAEPAPTPPVEDTLPGQLPLEMEQSDDQDPPEDQEDGVTDDPATWGDAREPQADTDTPANGAVEYDTTDHDYAIVDAVIKAGRYSELREEIRKARRLTRQQVANIKATLSRRANRGD